MNPALTTAMLNVLLCIVFLFVSCRAYYLYFRIHHPRLFVLGLSMGVMALTAAADFMGSSISMPHLHTDWFLFIGQTVSFVFLFLSMLLDGEQQLHILMRWQIAISAFLMSFLCLAPFLPDFPTMGIRVLLSGSRCVICFVILFYYISLFMRKGTSFSALMSIAFLLLSFGYLVLLPKYLLPAGDLLDHVADTMRIIGVASMFSGFVWGK